MSDYETFGTLPLFDAGPVAAPDHDGATYDAGKDKERLNTAQGRVYALMKDGKWRTLAEIAKAVGCSESGASARLRDFRKPKFKRLYPNINVHLKRFAGGLYKYKLEV